MAMMMGNLYEALLEGGATPDKAKKAAEEIADYPKQLSGVRDDLSFSKGVLGIVAAGVGALVIESCFV